MMDKKQFTREGPLAGWSRERVAAFRKKLREMADERRPPAAVIVNPAGRPKGDRDARV